MIIKSWEEREMNGIGEPDCRMSGRIAWLKIEIIPQNNKKSRP